MRSDEKLSARFNDIFLTNIRKIYFKLQKDTSKRFYTGVDINTLPKADPIVLFKELIIANKPLMIARFGSTELSCILSYLYQTNKMSYFSKSIKYINGSIPAFWFGKKILTDMMVNSGFFPANNNLLYDFCHLMLEDMKQLDVQLCWLKGEELLGNKVSAKKIYLFAIEPFFQKDPWTEALRGKKVLVIHPYAKSIEYQYTRREKIFKDQRVLPEMQLKTLKAIQSIAKNDVEYDSWFSALDSMKNQISQIDFDIALIGAGAYGFPLAAHIKRMGKQGIHIGGGLQLYFGIKGKRWDEMKQFQDLYNEYWIRPLPEEFPANYQKVEGGCYW